MSKRFEYLHTTLTAGEKDIAQTLNKYGNDGWQVVFISSSAYYITDRDIIVVIFMRERP
jgi:hypothetical protein